MATKPNNIQEIKSDCSNVDTAHKCKLTKPDDLISLNPKPIIDSTNVQNDTTSTSSIKNIDENLASACILTSNRIIYAPKQLLDHNLQIQLAKKSGEDGNFVHDIKIFNSTIEKNNFEREYFNKNDFPDPPGPVKNTFFPFSILSKANFCLSVNLKSLIFNLTSLR